MGWDWRLEPCREPAAVSAKPRPFNMLRHPSERPSFDSIPKGRSAEHRHGQKMVKTSP
ncbi:hypothetical protein V8C34DRAFT_286759 [Trichoderma compactum]